MNDSKSNVAELTVSEISGSIKRTVEGAFSHVRVRGEISGFRGPHSSGHAYFSIKDERARMDAVVWKGVYNRLKFKPEEGMEMIATGKVTTYPGSSKYQIVIEQLEPAGAGALMALLEERKKALAAEGLFDEGRKQLLPYMPKVIGVVTSPTGAVIRDILHRISDRFPVHVVVWPVRVQGDTSGDEVARAINGFNALDVNSEIKRPELIIVARGGGSLEDLWGFNDEVVVRAAAGSDIPLISAVGHETDWTLLDLVADQRAPTPTGAAEMAVPVKVDLDAMLANLHARLSSASTRIIDQRRQNFQALSRGIPSLDNLLALPRRRIDEAGNLLGKALQLNIVNKRRSLETPSGRLTPISLQASLQDRKARLSQQTLSLNVGLDRLWERKTTLFTKSDRALEPISKQLLRQLKEIGTRIDELNKRRDQAVENIIASTTQKLAAQVRILSSLSYTNVLERGFALVKDQAGNIVKSASNVETGQVLSLQFTDGEIGVAETSMSGIIEQKSTKPKSPKNKTSKDKPTSQGSLF